MAAGVRACATALAAIAEAIGRLAELGTLPAGATTR
jgi:hypothetical protein